MTKDSVGREITIGDGVAYIGARRSRVTVSKAEVTGFDERGHVFLNGDTDKRTAKAGHNIIIIQPVPRGDGT